MESTAAAEDMAAHEAPQLPDPPGRTTPKGTLTITHTAADGTLIDGTSRGDGTNTVLSAHGWRWARTLLTWYLPRSRDTTPKMDLIEATTAALQAAGFTVDVTIDATPRATVVVEADRAGRSADRAQALAGKADRLTEQAQQAHDRARAMSARIPFGQPILVGHHSERRDTRYRAKIDAGYRAASYLEDAATDTADKAGIAARSTDARNNPVTVANRIDRMTADARALQRTIDAVHAATPTVTEEQSPGYEVRTRELTDRHAELTEQITYWEQVQAEQYATGRAVKYDRSTVKAGDVVKIGGQWYRVTRANAKTVTVPSGLGSWTNTAPYARIQEHRPA